MRPDGNGRDVQQPTAQTRSGLVCLFCSPEGERHGNVAELKSKTKQEKAGQLILRLSQRGSALALPRL